MIGVLLPIYLSWADSVYVGGLKRYQTMGKLVLAMEMGGRAYNGTVARDSLDSRYFEGLISR